MISCRPVWITKALLPVLLIIGFGCASVPSPNAGGDQGTPLLSGASLQKPPSRKTRQAEAGRPPGGSGYQLMAGLKNDLETGRNVEPEQAERLIETAPDSAYARFLAGSIYLRNGDTDNAREHFLRSSELDPASGHALSALGDLFSSAGDLTEADRYYLKAYEVSADPSTANRLALLRIRGGYLESAREILSRTLEDFPGDIMTRNNLAIAMDMMGETSAGIDILAGDEISDPRLLRTRALLQLKEGHPERAAGDMETAFEAGSTDGEWLLMGTADLQQGKLAQAEDKFRSSIVARPSGYEGYLNLGLSLRRQGKFTEAEEAYKEGLARAAHPDLHLNLGVLYELYRGEPALALEHYRQYLLMEGPASDRVKGWVEYLEGVVEEGN